MSSKDTSSKGMSGGSGGGTYLARQLNLTFHPETLKILFLFQVREEAEVVKRAQKLVLPGQRRNVRVVRKAAAAHREIKGVEKAVVVGGASDHT